MNYTYECFKCGTNFTTTHDLEDTNKPTCHKCFYQLLSLRTEAAYLIFLGEGVRSVTMKPSGRGS